MSKKVDEKNKKKAQTKKILTYIGIGLVAIFLIWIIIINVKDNTVGSGSNYKVKEVNGINVYEVEGIDFKETEEKSDLILILVKDYGAMVAELYPSVAPITVANFQALIHDKFYNNVIFHRVINNFMIQTGDPTGTGYGGSEKTIKGEFDINGFENPLSHKRGILSMARAGATPETKETMNSASSQFFIVQSDSEYLDGNYAAFGELLYGYSVLDKIASVQTDENDKPLEDVVIDTIKFVNIIEEE